MTGKHATNLITGVKAAVKWATWAVRSPACPGKTVPSAAFYKVDRQPLEGEMEVSSGDVCPGASGLHGGLRNDYCTKRPQYHYTRYTPSSAAGLSLILRMDRSTSAMIRLLTRGDQLVDPLSGVQRRPVRHPAQSVGQLDQRIRRPGRLREYHPAGGRVGQALHTPVVSVPVYHQARVTRLVAADVPPLNAFPIILRRVRLDRDGKCQWGCIGGEKRLVPRPAIFDKYKN